MHAQLWAAVHPEQPAESVLARVAACCATVYRAGTAYQQQTAALYHIISLCLHDQFQRARDLLLMARLQERVQAGDQALMILFGVTLVSESILNICTMLTAVKIIRHQMPDAIETEEYEVNHVCGGRNGDRPESED